MPKIGEYFSPASVRERYSNNYLKLKVKESESHLNTAISVLNETFHTLRKCQARLHEIAYLEKNDLLTPDLQEERKKLDSALLMFEIILIENDFMRLIQQKRKQLNAYIQQLKPQLKIR